MARKGNWRGSKHHLGYVNQCERCGVVFVSARDLTRSCSDACRQALCRAAKKQKRNSARG
jgi:hypothetical protein